GPLRPDLLGHRPPAAGRPGRLRGGQRLPRRLRRAAVAGRSHRNLDQLGRLAGDRHGDHDRGARGVEGAAPREPRPGPLVERGRRGLRAHRPFGIAAGGDLHPGSGRTAGRERPSGLAGGPRRGREGDVRRRVFGGGGVGLSAAGARHRLRPAAERPRAGDRRGLAGHPGGRSDRPARQLFRAGRELTRRPAARPEAARAFRGRPLGGEPVRGADRGSHGPPDRLPVGRTGGRGSAGRQWIGTGRAGEQTTGGAQESAAPGETGGWRMNRPPRRRSQAARRDNLRSVNGTRTFLLAGALALALPWGVLAQAPAPPAPAPATAPADAYTARPARFATRPVIDGKLDEPVWKTATHLGGFTQLEPKEGEPATEQTEVYLGYDADNLYIAARCHDAQPDNIVTTSLTPDTDIGYDDTLQILLDTYHDGRSAFLFAT